MKLEQITYAPLRQSIKQLQYACDELGESEEVNQIRKAIDNAVDDILAGAISDADEKLTLVKAQINHLAGQRDTLT